MRVDARIHDVEAKTSLLTLKGRQELELWSEAGYEYTWHETFLPKYVFSMCITNLCKVCIELNLLEVATEVFTLTFVRGEVIDLCLLVHVFYRVSSFSVMSVVEMFSRKVKSTYEPESSYFWSLSRF